MKENMQKRFIWPPVELSRMHDIRKSALRDCDANNTPPCYELTSFKLDGFRGVFRAVNMTVFSSDI